MFKIMDLIPTFIKNLFKYVLGYFCILLCINCKEKCIDEEPTPTETPINSNDEINYNSIDKEKKKHKVEDKMKDKINNME